MTDPSVVSADVQEVLDLRVTNLEQLEVLLILREAVPRDCAAAELATSVRIAQSLVDTALESLSHAGFALVQTTAAGRKYRYAPQNPQLAKAIDRLADLYAQNPGLVIRILCRNAIERARSGAGRAFANAFLIKMRDTDA